MHRTVSTPEKQTRVCNIIRAHKQLYNIQKPLVKQTKPNFGAKSAVHNFYTAMF